MATSGSYDFALQRNDMVKSAFRLIGVGVRGEPFADEDVSNGAEALNMMLKHWMTQGLQLWVRQRSVLFLEKGKRQYKLGPTGDNTSAEDDFIKTAIKVAAVSGAVTVDVDDTTGMAVSDFIGIVTDDGTVHWTTISEVTDTDTVVLATALDDDAAVDNVVFSYTSKIQRPLRIYDAFIRHTTANDTPLFTVSQDEYRTLGSKTSPGTPNQYYFDAQLTNTELYLYPQPNDAREAIHFVAHRPFQDMDEGTNDFDFPQEWQLAIRYNLAVELAAEYGFADESTQALVISRADRYLDDVSGWDVENASVYFGADLQRAHT